ncbi:MAG: hypothetical protein K8W52_37030 [Deltaproteobacteria bacterium]|nr:hypothetical protein [Deltaproteobacteria bacterium]
MSNRVEREELTAALRLRYDYYSAETMLEAALARAGLAELPAYDHAQVRAFRAALSGLGDRLTAVDARLEFLVGATTKATESVVAPPPVVAPSQLATPSPTVPAAVAASAAPASPPPATTEPSALTAPSGDRAVTLELTGVAVDEDTEVMVCGSEPYLGDWDPGHAIPLARTGDTWSVSLDVAPGTPLAFKFLQRRASGEVIWEGGDNRTVKAAARIATAWR